MTDAGVVAVAAGCPNLEHFDVSSSANVTDAGVAGVAVGCPNLQEKDGAGVATLTIQTPI